MTALRGASNEFCRSLARASLLLVVAFTLAALSAGCCRGCSKDTESHVDVPITLDEVKRLHAPPDVIVSVARKEESVGNVACGHSALCVVVLPVVAYKTLFPKKWDEVKVTQAGNTTYNGRFETDGTFIEAVSRKGSEARLIGVLPLDELGKHVVVEVAHAAISPDGLDGAFVRTPIVPQVDLVSEYRAKLARENDAGDRADLLIECGSWLSDEARPLLQELLPKEADESAAETVTKLCANEREEAREAFCSSIVPSVSTNPGPKTAIAGFKATVKGSARSAPAAPFVDALVRHACEQKDTQVARAAIGALLEARNADALEAARAADAPKPAGGETRWPEIVSAARERAGACAVVSRQVWLDLVLGSKVSGSKLREALQDDAVDDDILKLLDSNAPEYRAVVVETMPQKSDDYQYVRALNRTTGGLSGAEYETLAKSYLKGTAISSDAARKDHQVALLDLFGRAEGEPRVTAAARKIIEGALAASPPDNRRPVLRAALVVLGVHDQAQAASAGLAGSDSYVIDYALRLAGCAHDELKKANARARANEFSDGDVGPLCTRQVTPAKK